MFHLEVPSHISAVDLESNVVVYIAGVADVVDSYRYFGCGNVVVSLRRCRAWETVEIRGELVCVDIQFRIGRQFGIFDVSVLVSLDPLDAERPSEFFVEISDDREVVTIVGLLGGAIIFADNKGDSVDRYFAVYQPAELASMS